MFDFNAILNAAIQTAVEEAVAAKMESAVADMIEREIKTQLEIHEIIGKDCPTEARVETMIERALDRYDFDTVVKDIINDATISIEW